MPIPLDSTLKRIKRENEEAAAAQSAQALGITYATLDNYPFSLETLSLVPMKTVQEKGYAAYLRSANKVRFDTVHPESEEVQHETAALATGWGAESELVVVSPSSLQILLTSYLQLLNEAADKEQTRLVQVEETKQHDYFSKIKSLDDFRQLAGTANTTELMDVILAAGFNQDASDIHLEPDQDKVTIRFRIDGVLRPVLEFPISSYHAVVSRIKMLSNLQLDEQNLAQDGRFSLANKGINADVRVSLIPTSYGEAVVMRILRQDMQRVGLSQLGFSEYNRGIIDRVIRKPYGLILVTGPTGSGKSTTLYAMLDTLNSPEKKIITLEDPVEYRLAGLQQSQIDTEHGFTFAEGLRGALRQDPDIVMVGEIRDPETAEIALNASLTGHLVLSTLHTNDAVTASTRFLEMGIAPFLMNGSIQMIIAQRLVRQLVPGSSPENPQYQHRLVIAEVLCPNQEFEQAVLNHQDAASLEEIAVRGGMVPMLQDGMDKVKAGLTTQAEISRVTEV